MVTMTAVLTVSCDNREKEVTALQWEELPQMPPVEGKAVQPGVAGPVAGISGGTLLVAGGANFEGEMPWRGGAKSYHDEIFLLENGNGEGCAWRMAAERLPHAMAYPACLSLEEGILCMGGETESGPLAEVFLLTVDHGKVVIRDFPPLPVPLSSPGAAQYGEKIYLAGGLDAAGATDVFMVLDLGDPGKGWQMLPPLPVPLSHGVVAAQSDGKEWCIYLFGGRNKTTAVHTFFSDIWKFTPSTAVWTREGTIMKEGQPLPLAAGTGLAAGGCQVLLFGGDPGIYFNRTETLNNALAVAGDSLKKELLAEKEALLSGHPGFLREILAYHTLRKEWSVIGEAPEGLPATTVAFFWGEMAVIPGGEIRPGVRTPGVTAFKMK